MPVESSLESNSNLGRGYVEYEAPPKQVKALIIQPIFHSFIFFLLRDYRLNNI